MLRLEANLDAPVATYLAGELWSARLGGMTLSLSCLGTFVFESRQGSPAAAPPGLRSAAAPPVASGPPYVAPASSPQGLLLEVAESDAKAEEFRGAPRGPRARRAAPNPSRCVSSPRCGPAVGPPCAFPPFLPDGGAFFPRRPFRFAQQTRLRSIRAGHSRRRACSRPRRPRGARRLNRSSRPVAAAPPHQQAAAPSQPRQQPQRRQRRQRCRRG